MIKKPYKKAIAVFAAIILCLSASPVSRGQYQTPSYVRVGLYYKDSTSNTALSVFNVSAANGIQAGYFKDNNFTELYGNTSSATCYVRKDALYYNAGGTLKEYTASGASAAAAYTKYGPYHIKIGSDYPDRETAEAQAAACRDVGVRAYIAYVDTWQVWAGDYTDSTSAEAAIAGMTAILGEADYTVISPAAGRIVLTDAQFQTLSIFGSSTAYFQLRPAEANNPPVIRIKNKPYRGALEVRRFSTSDMTIISYVSMRDYLYGNVPAEIGGKSPAEAIKAQAVAAKMYAVNNMGKHSKTGFDLYSTTYDQVYQGYSYEVAQCNAAIDQVLDRVITYDGKFALAYYFSSSGGRTEDAQNVWGKAYPYLVSVDDKYETTFNWTKTLRASDVKAKLPSLGNILGISITRKAPTGRVTELAVRGDKTRDPAYYTLVKCSSVFSLNSQLYTITTDADVYAASLSNVPTATADTSQNPAGGMLLAYAAPQNKASASTAEANGNMAAMAAASANASAAAIDLNAAAPAGTTATVSVDTAAEPNTTPAAVSPLTTASTIAAANLSLRLPSSAAPVKTLIGGKMAATASGTVVVKGENNKVTILGAGGAVRKATLVPETYTFTGKGWGHAVGMSQRGAIGMGKAGMKFEAILTHFFKGTHIETE